MVPPVLDAVQYVQQNYYETPSAKHALVGWQLVATDAEAAKLAPMLTDWWQTYLDNPPHWSVALLALDQMLASAGDRRSDMRREATRWLTRR